MAGENDASFLVRMPSQMLAAVKDVAGDRGAGGFIREAIQEKLDGVPAPVIAVRDLTAEEIEQIKHSGPSGDHVMDAAHYRPMPGRPVTASTDIRSVAGKPDKDPRFEVVFAAIRKRGRASVRQIVSDTGLTDGVVEMVLRKSSDRVDWPLPGIAEMVG
jgi:hypothetical protein